MQRTRVFSYLRLVADRTKILMRLFFFKGKWQLCAYFTEQESQSHQIYSEARLRGSCPAVHTSQVSARRESAHNCGQTSLRSPRRAARGDRVRSAAIRHAFPLGVSVITMDTRPPSSQCANKRVWHATMQRIEWHREPAGGRSGPAVGTLRAGARRRQLPPLSEGKCASTTACARKDNYCGR